MKIQPIIDALDAGKSEIQRVEQARSVNPLQDGASDRSVYVMLIQERSSRPPDGDICPTQWDTASIEVDFVCQGFDQLDTIRTEARGILVNIGVDGQFSVGQLLREQGDLIEISGGKIAWRDIYTVRTSYTPE